MSGSKALIIVAEDDENVRAALTDALQAVGHEVEEAANGSALLAKTRGRGRRPDLILLDLRMPVLSGWEFLAIRNSDPVLLMVPVIVISGEDEAPAQFGQNASLRKPVDPRKLRAVVEEVLEETNPDPERRPRPTEPWSIDPERPTLLRNRLGHVVAVVATEREARRVAAAVNGVSQVSTEALQNGIIDKGIECLYELHRYDTDPAFKDEIDAGPGFASVAARREEVARLLGFGTRGRGR